MYIYVLQFYETVLSKILIVWNVAGWICSHIDILLLLFIIIIIIINYLYADYL